MPTPVSPRAASAVLAAAACAGVAIVLTLVWPGYLAPVTPGCPPSGVPTATIGHLNYCFEPVRLTAAPLRCPLQPNQNWSGPSLGIVFWGFAFNLARYSCGNISGIAIKIMEPDGTVSFGATDYGGAPGTAMAFGVFTNDGDAGVMANPVDQSQNATLYVETGT